MTNLFHKYLILFLIVLYPLLGSGQQLELKEHDYYRSSDFLIKKFQFSDRYNFQGNDDIFKNLTNTSFYKQHKVKKIEVFDSKNVLVRMIELDTVGKIVKQGYRNSYFFHINETASDKSSQITVNSYFNKNKLMKVDTLTSTYYDYINADTIIKYVRTSSVSYKNGDLINEQNRYYNDQYYNKPFISNGITSSPFVRESKKIKKKAKPVIFLKKELLRNYDTTILYQSRFTSSNKILSFSIDSGKTSINFEETVKYPFVKKYQKKSYKDTCYTDGESFREPTQYDEPHYRCSQYYNGLKHLPHYSYKTNEQGLYEYYVSTYHSADVNVKPVTTIIYSFKYDFFE